MSVATFFLPLLRAVGHSSSAARRSALTRSAFISKNASAILPPFFLKRPGGGARSIITQLSPTLSHLRSDSTDNDVFLVGTAHISRSSADEVTELIRDIRPDFVFVELDPARAARLRHGTDDDEFDAVERALTSLTGRVGGIMPGMASLPGFGAGMGGGGEGPFGSGSGSGSGSGANTARDMLQDFFKKFYAILKQYGYIPGVEMKAAMESADAVGATLVCGDRDSNDTMQELGAALSNPATLWKLATARPSPELEAILRSTMGGGGNGFMDGLDEGVERLKTRKNAAIITEWMEEALPEVADVMIRRRDKEMARNLKGRCGRGRAVAVVGMAHVDGIEREWQDLGSMSVKSLSS